MKLPFSSLWAEFKAFAFKGNMIELAVAVIIGGAFGSVVTSLTQDVIMPTIGYVIHKGEQAAAEVKQTAAHAASAVAAKTGLTTQPASEPSTQPTTLPVPTAIAASTPAPPAAIIPPADDKPKPAEPIKIDLMIGPIPVGKFIGALLNFIIVAFAVFIMVVKLMGSVMKRMNKPQAPGEPTTRECPECLSLIPIKARRCSHCTTVIAPGPA
jgi:large conductance mechanosensitive channel